MANHIFLLPLLILSAFVGVTVSAASIPYPEVFNSLKTNPNGSLHDLFDAGLQESLLRAQTAHKLLLDMDQSLLDDRSKSALTDCIYLYQDSIDDLNRSIASKNKYFDVQTWLSSAIANEQTCQNGFLDFGLPSLLSQNLSLNLVNTDLSKFLSNALAINKAISSLSSPRVSKSKSRLSSRHRFPRWFSSDDRKFVISSSNKKYDVIVVAQDGSANYTTIAQGLAAAATAMNGSKKVIIYIKKGVYKEYVVVEKSMKNLTMIGDGIDETIITGSHNVQDDASMTTFRSATFSALGEGFIARGITFENTAGPEKHQAVALLSTSDNSVFFRCSFKGYQDTLYVHSNRQFYRECDIYGTIDFIFGDAATVIQDCNIYLRKAMPKQKNAITAQGKQNPETHSGIIIHRSLITAAAGETPGESYLGRPWKLYSTTVFIKCVIDDVIAPAGWLEWDGDFALSTLYYGEYNNIGGGANTDGRVKWPGFHVITSADDAERFAVGNFLDGDSWLLSTGVPYSSTL